MDVIDGGRGIDFIFAQDGEEDQVNGANGLDFLIVDADDDVMSSAVDIFFSS